MPARLAGAAAAMASAVSTLHFPGCRTAPGTSLEVSPGSYKGWGGRCWVPKGTVPAWVVKETF